MAPNNHNMLVVLHDFPVHTNRKRANHVLKTVFRVFVCENGKEWEQVFNMFSVVISVILEYTIEKRQNVFPLPECLLTYFFRTLINENITSQSLKILDNSFIFKCHFLYNLK